MREYLKNLRTGSGLTQGQAAERLKMTLCYYNQIERGERQRDMSLSLVTKLAKLFGVSEQYIIQQEKRMV